MRWRALAVVLSIGFTLSAAACSDRRYDPGTGADPDAGPVGGADTGGSDTGGPIGNCAAPPPPSAPCFKPGCQGDLGEGYVCRDGAWVCPPGTSDRPQDCSNTCSQASSLQCVDGCGGDYYMDAVCTGGTWQCPEGFLDPASCPAGTCWGPPSQCCDGTEPACQGGDYVCADGTLPGQVCPDMCPEQSPVPPDDSSRQTVRFNFPAGSGWLVTQGQGCGPLDIEQVGSAGSEPLDLGLPYQVICEGPPPPSTGATTVVDLSAGATAAVTWDARALVTYDVCTDCSAQGWTGEGVVHSTGGFYRAVSAGHYRATFSVADDVSTLGCQRPPPGTSGPVYCNPPYDGGASYGEPYALCNAQRVITVEFDLPASGDVDVEVQ
jgi:hypothetical protein